MIPVNLSLPRSATAFVLSIALSISTLPALAAKPAAKIKPTVKHGAAKSSKSAQINAYDIFVDAAGMLVDSDKIGYALAQEHNSGNPLDREYTLEEKTALVQENASALAKLRQGFAYEYHNPPMRSFSTIALYYSEFRKCARLLELEASVAKDKHDEKTAINSSLDAIQLGEMIQRDSPILGMLVGVACQSIGRHPLWELLLPGSTSDGSAAKAGAQRLARILALHTPYTEILKTEKETDIACLAELYQHPSIAATTARQIDEADESGDLGQVASQLFSLLLQDDKDQVIISYSNQMDSLIERYSQPYTNAIVPISRQSDPLSLSKYKLFYESRFKDVASEMANRCLVTMLALDAYYFDKNAYPETLSALAPTYIPRIFGDPFAGDTPMKYSTLGQPPTTYMLYSVGPDGQDDGGKPAINQFAKTDYMQKVIVSDSIGDFNSGISRY